MTAFMIVLVAAIVLGVAGRLYSNFLARSWGEEPARVMPATIMNDGRDYVPTPTPVVFAHHFASIAGAGPIIGPVLAICFGWLPALIWVLVGGVLIGAMHDYLATHMATREGGQSIATVTRRTLGRGPFVALMIFLVVSLALVCATFLNLSATALTSMVPFDRLGLSETQTLFRVADGPAGREVVIGGIASMSVIIITALAPLVGWMYLKKNVRVWKCSALAVVICIVSISVGLKYPVQRLPIIWSMIIFAALAPLMEWMYLKKKVRGWKCLVLGGAISVVSIAVALMYPARIDFTTAWKLVLALYVLVAAGLPVWLFLQSRDFINVHILYVGMAALLGTLVIGGLRGTAGGPGGIPAVDMVSGTAALGAFWPALFITIACGAVSGFHSLCAGGTTCKQLTTERGTRQVGYGAMLLESFLAACVIAILVAGLSKANYLADVHPQLAQLTTKSNPILAFAMAVGNAVRGAFGLPVAAGAIAGMILLEGFLVTTLDTAVRLTRYLLEEIWKVVFALDVELEPAAEVEPSGAGGLPTQVEFEEGSARPARTPSLPAWKRTLAACVGHYWVNSGLAVGLTLLFAFSGGLRALWNIFATANQLLAAMVLLLGTLWLLKKGKRVWNVFVPAIAMLVTTVASLVVCFQKYTSALANLPTDTVKRQEALMQNSVLLVADIVIFVITAYLIVCGVQTAMALLRKKRPAQA